MKEYKRNRKLRNLSKPIFLIAFSSIIIQFTAFTAHTFESALSTQVSEIKVLTKNYQKTNALNLFLKMI